MLNNEECAVFWVTQTENRRLTITVFGLMLGEIFMLYLTIGSAAWEACSATWNLHTNVDFTAGPEPSWLLWSSWSVAGPVRGMQTSSPASPASKCCSSKAVVFKKLVSMNACSAMRYSEIARSLPMICIIAVCYKPRQWLLRHWLFCCCKSNFYLWQELLQASLVHRTMWPTVEREVVYLPAYIWVRLLTQKTKHRMGKSCLATLAVRSNTVCDPEFL